MCTPLPHNTSVGRSAQEVNMLHYKTINIKVPWVPFIWKSFKLKDNSRSLQEEHLQFIFWVELFRIIRIIIKDLIFIVLATISIQFKKKSDGR